MGFLSFWTGYMLLESRKTAIKNMILVYMQTTKGLTGRYVDSKEEEKKTLANTWNQKAQKMGLRNVLNSVVIE